MKWDEAKEAANQIMQQVVQNGVVDPVGVVYNDNLYKAVCDCLVYCYVHDLPRDVPPASTLLQAHKEFCENGGYITNEDD